MKERGAMIDLSGMDMGLALCLATGQWDPPNFRFSTEKLAGLQWVHWTDYGTPAAHWEIYKPLGSLNGIEACTGLTTLEVPGNHFEDLAPLAGLKHLTWLNLQGSPVKDLTPLAGLTALDFLNLEKTAATDLSPLSGLSLTRLNISHILGLTDLSPLAGLRSLRELLLRDVVLLDCEPLLALENLQTLYLYGVREWHDGVPEALATLQQRGVGILADQALSSAIDMVVNARRLADTPLDEIADQLRAAGCEDLAGQWLLHGPRYRHHSGNFLHLLVERIRLRKAPKDDSEAAALVRTLVRAGVDPRHLNHRGESPLATMAPRPSHPETFDALLEVSDLNHPAYNPPLVVAFAFCGDKEAVKNRPQAIIDAGADLTGPAVLSALAGRGYLDLVKQALEAGADPNQQIGGALPLDAAANGDHVEVMAALLEAGADPNAWVFDRTMRRPVHSVRSVEALAVLEAAGADIYMNDSWGYTLLHLLGEKLERPRPGCSAEKNARQTLALADALLARGFSVSALTRLQRNALQVAIERMPREDVLVEAVVGLAERLVAAGAEPFMPRWTGTGGDRPKRLNKLVSHGITSQEVWCDKVLALATADIGALEPETRPWLAMVTALEHRKTKERLQPAQIEALKERVRTLLMEAGVTSELLLNAADPEPGMAWLTGGVLPSGETIWDIVKDDRALLSRRVDRYRL